MDSQSRRVPESTGNREERLRRRRERERARRASETADQRHERLRVRRERDRARRAARTAADRAVLLQQRRLRLSTESSEERETRLQRMSNRLAAETTELQQERLAAETTEERAARLQQMSERQRERLAAETTDERVARLQHDQESHRGAQSDLPLFEQPDVRARMCKFHAHLAALESPRCTTCSEAFPGLQLRLQSTECLRCSRDKHTPKLYSIANNTDPGLVPPQLQVRQTSCFMSYFCSWCKSF